MSGAKRITIVIIVVLIYNYFNQPLFNIDDDLSMTNVVVTLCIAMVVYTGLLFLAKRKKKD